MQTQGFGGMVGLGIVLLWRMREELKQIFMSALNPRHVTEHDVSQEPFSYRFAVIGVMSSIVITVGFLWLGTGVNPLFGFLSIVFYLLMDIALGRLRAEAGIGIAHTNFLVTEQMSSMFGSSAMRVDNAVGLGFLGGLYWRQIHDIGFTLEFMKLGDSQGMKRRTVMSSIWLSLIITLILGFLIYLPTIFQSGIPGNWSIHYIEGQIQWERIANTLSTRKPANIFQVGIGALVVAFTWFLSEMTIRFVWWPFHPLGYALSLIDWVWLVFFPCFVAWVLKGLVFRYGGNKLYRYLSPAFIGLVLGDVFVYFITSIFLIIQLILS
jgi:hypothetical protein